MQAMISAAYMLNARYSLRVNMLNARYSLQANMLNARYSLRVNMPALTTAFNGSSLSFLKASIIESVGRLPLIADSVCLM